MKTLLSLLLLCSLTATAQSSSAPDTTESKFYVGVELSTISYLISNHAKSVSGMFTPVAHVHVGYRLSERASIQVGLAYGETDDNFESIYFKTADSTIYKSTRLSNRGLAIPITLQLTPFNPGRRLNVFATASLIPIIGEVSDRRTETLDGKTDIMFDAHDSGIYTIFTAGVILNYKISKRLEGYGKVSPLYKVVGKQSNYADSNPRPLALGVNYNF
ncbi:outer membrane beta-barrel protein [Pontibacter sp. CAU 1760]